MHICNVYDFKGPNGYFFNGLDYDLIPEFQSLDFKFDKNTIDLIQKDKGTISSFLGDIVSLKNTCISDLDLNKKDVIYFYNLNTNGNLKHFLGMSKNSQYIRNSGFHFISKLAMNYVKSLDNFYITIYSGLENEIDKYDIVKFYKECLDYNIPRNKIIYFSNLINPRKILELFKNKFKIKSSKDFLFLNFNEQLLNKGDELIDKSKSNFFVNENNLSVNKKNKFLFFNRRLRPHRLIILSLLCNDGFLDDNLVSFDFDYDNGDYLETYIIDNNYIAVDEYHDASELENKLLPNHFIEDILNGYSNLKKIKKKSLDVSNLNYIEGRDFEVDDISLYNNSCFSIVAETEFFDEWKEYTTEKILKPIQQLHPFVVVGRPNILKDLKSYGFKTFSDFWDESYDSEENNSVRIQKVYSTIKTLTNKTFLEWEYMYSKLKPILIHNQKVLSSYNGTENKIKIEKNIIKILSDESIQNYQRVL